MACPLWRGEEQKQKSLCWDWVDVKTPVPWGRICLLPWELLQVVELGDKF